MIQNSEAIKETGEFSCITKNFFKIIEKPKTRKKIGRIDVELYNRKKAKHRKS